MSCSLSIIIPVFNASRYIISALDSVLGKGSFVHLYLTDDGSTDDSLAICRRYASKHSNITVLSQSNAGPSAARNSALAIAQEEYITFLDADDEIEPGTLQKNLEWLQAHPDVDALFYPIQSVHFDGSVTQKVAYTETAVLSKEDAWEKWCCGDKNLPGYFGGKIYARKLFEGLKIPEHLRFAEDMYLLSDLLAQTNKICMSPYGNYRYYERENAATQTPWTESKASNIGEAYFHRWEVAVQLQLSDAGTVNAWRLALAEVVAERKKFPDILAKELDALKSMRPTWAQLLRKLVLRQALGSLLLLFKSR